MACWERRWEAMLRHVLGEVFRSRSLKRSRPIATFLQSAAAGAVLCLGACGWDEEIDPGAAAAPFVPVASVPRMAATPPPGQLASLSDAPGVAALAAGRRVTYLVRASTLHNLSGV